MAIFGMPGGPEIWIIFIVALFLMAPALMAALVAWLVVASKPKDVRPLAPAGWLADPAGRHELRYWDGVAWTAHVSDAGTPSEDAL